MWPITNPNRMTPVSAITNFLPIVESQRATSQPMRFPLTCSFNTRERRTRQALAPRARAQFLVHVDVVALALRPQSERLDRHGRHDVQPRDASLARLRHLDVGKS